ncbi:MAG: hydrogenase maturation nickel metallochaperone HypA [Bacteroidetes bacterium]|nr:hydrogenase maturation nickel metallochaperone HypA [Bacteroidota bacterium]
MHELTVAGNIIAIVTSETRVAGAVRVSEVCLEIGRLAGIEYESLEFALTALKPATVMSDALIVIEKPGGKAGCRACGKTIFFDSFMGACDSCGSADLEITGGNELRVKSITI